MSEAKHFDGGKCRVDLVPAEIIWALGQHYGMGATKYGDNNWLKGMPWSKLYGSALRHLLEWRMGESIGQDDKTGDPFPHLIAAMWNIGALHYYELHGLGTDDRIPEELRCPTPGSKSSQTIAATGTSTCQCAQTATKITGQ